MLYRCKDCASEYDYPPLKLGVVVVCEACSGRLEGVEIAGSKAQLLVSQDGKVVGHYDLAPESGRHEETIPIGRSEENRIVLADQTVSSHHAELFRHGADYHIRDLGSRNGTYVNGVPATDARLQHRAQIRIGIFTLRFEQPDLPVVPGGVSLTSEESTPDAVVASFRPGTTLVDEAPSPDGASRPDYAREAATAELARLRRALVATASLSNVMDEPRILEQLAGHVFDLLKPERFAVFLRAAESSRLRTALARDKTGASLPEEIWISRTIAARVLGEKLALVTSDARVDPRFSGRSILEKDIRSAIVAPLLHGENLLGLVWADTREEGRRFQEADLPILSGLAQVATVALTNARLVRRVRVESETRAYLSRYLAPQVVQLAMTQGMKLETAGEIKEITILFSDLRGFTTLSEQLSPPKIVELLNGYFTRMVDCVFKNGGTLLRFVGDAMLAIWGMPLHRPEDPLLAVRAAMSMQEEVALLNHENAAKGLPPLAMGIGVHTGPAVVANVGSPRRMEWTAMGSAVNLASRIESQTGPGDIFVSRETFDLLGGVISAEPLPPIQVKNVSQPVRLHRILRHGN